MSSRPLCLASVLGGGVAYAANTVFSSDIVNDQVFSADVRNDDLPGGGLSAVDLRSGSVGTAEAVGLRSVDIANTGFNGSDDVNANLLDGIDATWLVHGQGSLLSNRLVFVPGDPPKTLFVIPGLGELVAHCFDTGANIDWKNTTSSPVDRWADIDGNYFSAVEPPGADQAIVQTGSIDGTTLALGRGNDPGARRIATIQAFAFQSADGAPCGFQAQGTLWTSG
jgi:hypothetical protein